MKSKYEQQAEAFLKATNTDFKCEFLFNGKYFCDDKEMRDVYRITLTRGRRSYTFHFGQSIVNSGFYYTKGRKVNQIDRSQLTNKHLVAWIKLRDYDFLNNGTSDTIHIKCIYDN